MRVRLLCVLSCLSLIIVCCFTQISAAVPSRLRDGPAPCTAGNPPAPFGGMCATYNGNNTWWGSYGPGFPSAPGWGLCADAPNSAHVYPYPGYQYKASAAPAGTNTGAMNPLGFAFSQFSALGYWNGVKGSYTKDEAFVAANIFYEAQAFNIALPEMPLGVDRAYQALANFFNAAVGASANPGISLAQQGGGSSFTDSTTLIATVTFPGTNRGITGLSITLSLTNAIADATGTSSVTASTAKNGTIAVPITAVGPGPLHITATATTSVGKRGMAYFSPTAEILSAQAIAAPLAASTITSSAQFTSEGPVLYSQTFQKSASGNIDPSQISLAGAVIDIRNASGFLAATCITVSSGRCTTPTSLIDGTTYTWLEISAPPGLAAGATGTFTASSSSSVLTINLVDPGTMVHIEARKVDAGSPQVTVPGATFDLYRMDDGSGPNHPLPPSDASPLTGGTWVARASSTTDPASFGWQFPNYSYCIRELLAPSGYLRSDGIVCSGLIEGTTDTPPTTEILTLADREQTTELYVQKDNVAQPGQGVPGATYDLYVKDPIPISTPPDAPIDAVVEPGMSWYARGTTSQTGHLVFTIPTGHSWCVRELHTPSDFILDPALHCTEELHRGQSDPVHTVAVKEVPRDIVLSAYKFNASKPGIGVPNAVYALFVQGALPDGYEPVPVPAGITVPAAMTFFASATTSARGILRFTLPAGHSWCLQELSVPSNYQLDRGLHCSGVLWTSTTRQTSIALPEVPSLPDTGNPLEAESALATALLAGGLTLMARRRYARASPKTQHSR